eukprot:TRINITY_DN6652_c0_g1_i1.p1 TRINITY_DN6652_c0_g1~~TRINITY_DN6652_c0_g1_i1.p1  ORF type:complete len:512 (-),score=41.30 TRINITY_DN6652_c0_g1_i1:161-1696(-)
MLQRLQKINWRRWRSLKSNFLFYHFMFITLFSLFGGLIIWAIEDLTYMNALFTSTSSMTGTGMYTIDYSQLTIYSKVITLVQSVIGDWLLLSLVPPILRYFYYQKQMFLQKDKDPGYITRLSFYSRTCILLITVVLAYWILFQLVAFLILGLYMEYSSSAHQILKTSVPFRIPPWWWAFFHSTTSFNNAGMSLFQNNLVPCQTDQLILLVLSFNIIFGNTLFPVVLRIIIWVLSKITYGLNKECFIHLLQEPRHYYTHLFPLKETIIVFASWVVITGIEYSLYFVEWDYSLAGYSVSDKFLIAYFQTISVRSAGFNVVDIGSLSTGHLALYTLTMYISAYPFIISIRSTNSKKDEDNKQYKKEAKNLVGRDLLWMYLAVILIAYIEHYRDYSQASNIFLRIVFEISSGFGTVGLSMGYPNEASFSGHMHPVSQFIVMLVMLFGRHRGLPRHVDPAINIGKQRKNDARLERRMSQNNMNNNNNDNSNHSSMDHDIELNEISHDHDHGVPPIN